MNQGKVLDIRGKILFLCQNPSRDFGGLCFYLKKFYNIEKTEQGKAFAISFQNDVELVLLTHTNKAPAFQLLDLLRTTIPAVPVIVLADRGSEKLAVKMFRHGAGDYLSRPFKKRELRERVEAILGGKGSRVSEENPGLLSKAIEYINENYVKRLRVSQVARETGMSLSSFERAFKREIGSTFSRYVSKLRIIKAEELLKKQSLSISEIAASCGFTNQYHFTRKFKKIMKIPPRDYRRSFQKNAFA